MAIYVPIAVVFAAVMLLVPAAKREAVAMAVATALAVVV